MPRKSKTAPSKATALAVRKAREDNVAARLRQGEAARHNDAWINLMTGLGTLVDRAAHTQFQADAILDPFEAGQMYANDDIVKIVVDTWPEQMLREGWTIKGPPPALCEFLDAEAERLDLHSKLEFALTWGPLFGGNLLWIGTDDPRPPEEPRGPYTRINWLENIDRRYANPRAGDPILHPSAWDVYPIDSRDSGRVAATVHHTRAIKFGGAKTEDQARMILNGWDYSVLQSIQAPLRAFHDVFSAMTTMMTDASTAVMKLKGVIDAVAGKRSEEMRARAQLLNTVRSVARMVLLDADPKYEEKFDKVTTQFAGVSDNLVMASKRIAAATRIPVPILMGEAPAGLNATGDSIVRMFYDQVNAYRKRRLARPLLRILRIMAAGRRYDGPLSVEFPSLWQESPKETADRRKVVADTDAVYLDHQVLSAETVAKNRFRASGWSPETELQGDESAYTPPPALPAAVQPPPRRP